MKEIEQSVSDVNEASRDAPLTKPIGCVSITHDSRFGKAIWKHRIVFEPVYASAGPGIVSVSPNAMDCDYATYGQ